MRRVLVLCNTKEASDEHCVNLATGQVYNTAASCEILLTDSEEFYFVYLILYRHTNPVPGAYGTLVLDDPRKTKQDAKGRKDTEVDKDIHRRSFED